MYRYFPCASKKERNWDKSLKSFPPCYSQSPLLTDLGGGRAGAGGGMVRLVSINGLKLVCNLNIVYGNLKSENSRDCAQKLYVHEFGFRLIPDLCTISQGLSRQRREIIL